MQKNKTQKPKKKLQNGPKIVPKWGPKWVQNGSLLGVQKRSKKIALCHDPFWTPFWITFGHFSGPKSFQKSCFFKNHFFSEKCWIFENRALAYVKRPFLKGKADFRAFQCGPKSPKMGSKGPKEAIFFVIILSCFGTIFAAICRLQKRRSHCRKTTIFEKHAC